MTSGRQRWLIYTFHGVDIRRYPAVEAYLLPFKEDLESRVTDQPWYELQQPQYAYRLAFEGAKIVYPEFATWPEFAFDDGHHYISNKLFCIPTRQKWLVGVLNSLLTALILADKCSAVHGGTLEHRKIYVQQLPIVEPSEADKRRLEELVDELQALGGQGPRAEALEREVDEIVYRTYGLTADEIKVIEDWHAERRALLGKGKRRGNGDHGGDVAEENDGAAE